MRSFTSYLCLVLVTLLFIDGATSRDIFFRPKNYTKNIEIVGGYNTTIEEHPYQVWLNTIGCSGSIISENYILTAAHCLYGQNPTYHKSVQAGSTYRSSGYTEIPIADFIVADYDPVKYNKDVALIRTKEPIQFTNTIQPVKLPSRGRPLEDDTVVTVSGWGLNKEQGQIQESLLAVDVPVCNFDECNKAYAGVITENMFCAGYLTGGKDACQGDSGGPAVQNGMLVGIVSWGFGCARPNHPGVYTNVAAPYVRDFIQKHTGL